MANKTAIILGGVSVWFAIGLLSGCNAVLDIQEAQLSSSAGSANAQGGSTGTMLNVHSSGCQTAKSACSSCVTTACGQPEMNTCLTDKACRAAMDGYNSCLGSSCTAEEDTCFAPLSAINGPVPDCMLGCKNDCSASAIFTTCQLYCGCMANNCEQKFSDPSIATDFASATDCVSQCMNFPADIVTCRWSHCELAGLYPKENHCDHAVGIGLCGLNTVTRAPDCTDKNPDTFGCASDSECCSGNCDQSKNRTCREP